MSVRPSTVWVLVCDAPDCHRLAVPSQLSSWHRNARGRALHLSHAVEAFKAAGASGWVQEPQGLGKDWKTFCPDHVDVPSHPQPIRPGDTRETEHEEPTR